MSQNLHYSDDPAVNRLRRQSPATFEVVAHNGHQHDFVTEEFARSELPRLFAAFEVSPDAFPSAYVTDANEDGTPAFTFEPWSDGHAVGFRVTRHADGAKSYVYLNPSADTFNDGAFSPDAFVYTGPHGNPAQDSSHHFYDIDFPEA